MAVTRATHCEHWPMDVPESWAVYLTIQGACDRYQMTQHALRRMIREHEVSSSTVGARTGWYKVADLETALSKWPPPDFGVVIADGVILREAGNRHDRITQHETGIVQFMQHAGAYVEAVRAGKSVLICEENGQEIGMFIPLRSLARDRRGSIHDVRAI
jgi:hypothetical protein